MTKARSQARSRGRSPAQALLLSEEALQLVAARFRALGDPSRLRIVNALRTGERSVQQLVAATELSQPNVSHHLALLRRAGLVVRRSEGNRALYRLGDSTVMELCRLVCGGISERLNQELEALEGAGI